MNVLTDTYPLSRQILLESDEIISTLSDGALLYNQITKGV